MTDNSRADARFNSPTRDAGTRDRVIMAAGWEVGDAIPDRAYSLMGKWLAQYWEADVLRPDRFDRLHSIVRSLGTLAHARAIHAAAAVEIAKASLGVFTLRGYPMPADAREIVARWLEEGAGDDPQHLLTSTGDLGDPKHKPTSRPVCRACGAKQ